MPLAACGGGGGVNSPGGSAPPTATPTPAPPTTPTPAPPPTSADAAEYQASDAVVWARAAYAYDRQATGRGVTIANLDTDIGAAGREFAGRVSPDSTSFDQRISRCATCEAETIRFGVEDVTVSGTRVARIAADAPASGALTTASSTIDLSPSAREMDVDLGWSIAPSWKSSLRLGVARAFDAGDVSGATDTATSSLTDQHQETPS
jgi:hypothetical protein